MRKLFGTLSQYSVYRSGWMLLQCFKRLDIVADTYRTNSIKSGEKNTRGSSQRVIIAYSKLKLTHDFFEFLKNGENKTCVIEIVSELLRINFSKVLVKLRYSVVYISQKDVTYCITENRVTINENYHRIKNRRTLK